MKVHKAVVLAAGEGSRMRTAASGAPLSREQRAAADAGHKALMPIASTSGERPFLDYTVAALAGAGIDQVCVIVGAKGQELEAYVEGRRRGRIELTTVVQTEPRGTADALACAWSFTADEPFLMLNGDTYCPAPGLRRLARIDGAGLLVAERAAALADPTTNLTVERLASFALVETDDAGLVCRLEEKPGHERYGSLPDPVLSSTNCWRFEAAIYRYCAEVEPSPRGELELPTAVQSALDDGMSVRAVAATGLLDLSSRRDVEAVGRLLAGAAAVG